MKKSFFVLILCPVAVLAQTLVFINGPMDTTACIGSIAIIPCGFDNVSNLFNPDWRIIKRSDDGSVISELDVRDINNDDNDGLQYITDLSSGMNTSPNSRLLVGPVDETDNQSSYQCIFNIGDDVFESSIGTLIVTGIPAIDNLSVTDRCTNVTASWDISEGPCRDLSYNVTLSSSDGVTLGPFTTNNTNYTFTGVDIINGNISVNVLVFNGNSMGGNVSETAVIGVSPNDRPTATIRSLSPCITSFNISWDASNSITCGVVFYDVSISPPPTEGNPVATTVDRFYSVTRLNNSLRSVTLTARNRAGQTEITRDVQLLVPRDPPPVENLSYIISNDDLIISWDRPDIDDCTTLPITCYAIDANVTFENKTQTRYMLNFTTNNNMDRFEISYNERFVANFVPSATYNISVSSTCGISMNTIIINVPPRPVSGVVVVAVAVAWYVIVIIIICGVTYYILLMGSIYCCIKIIKEDAYNREYKEPGCCALVIFGIMSLGIAPLIYFIWKICCREKCKEKEYCCKKECCCRTMIEFTEYLFLVLSLGIGYLMWKIYNMKCWCCKGQNSKGSSLVQPGMSMEEKSSDVYDSPGMKQEHTDIDETKPKTEEEPAVYHYARTGPIHVVMPGSQQQQPEPAESDKKKKKK